jgi:hypothetical protein
LGLKSSDTDTVLDDDCLRKFASVSVMLYVDCSKIVLGIVMGAEMALPDVYCDKYNARVEVLTTG